MSHALYFSSVSWKCLSWSEIEEVASRSDDKQPPLMVLIRDAVVDIARQDAHIGKAISAWRAKQSGVAVSSRSHSSTLVHTKRRLHIPGH